MKRKYSAVFMTLILVFCIAVSESSAAVKTDRNAGAKSKTEAVLSNYEMYQMGANEVILGLSGTVMPEPIIELFNENDIRNTVAINEVRITFKNTHLNKKDMTDRSDGTPIISSVILEQVNTDIVITMQAIEPLKLRMKRGTAPANEYMLRFISTEFSAKGQRSAEATKQQPLPPKLPSPFTSQEKISLNLRDTELRDVFRLMGSYLNKNIIIDPSLPTTLVTLTLTDVPMSDAFDYLADTYELAWRTIGNNTIVIGTRGGLPGFGGKEETRSFQIAYADLGAIQGLLSALANVPAEKITIDQRMRTIYVRATPDKFIEISNVLQEIDSPGRQVMIQAKIFEFSDGATKEVETTLNAVYDHWWLNYSGSGGLRSGYADDNRLDRNLNLNTQNNTMILPIHTDLKTPMQGLWREFDAAFRAVEDKNLGQTIANPSVITIDGKQANVSMTEYYPYISGRDDAGNPTWSHKNVGPTLTFTPYIGRDGMITLDLYIETGEVIEMITGSTGEQMPRTSNRSVKTTVRVRNGAPFVVGGLFRDTKITSRLRIPILGNLPLLGELFTYRNDVRRKTQVVMLVIPYILDIPDTPVEHKMIVVQPN